MDIVLKKPPSFSPRLCLLVANEGGTLIQIVLCIVMMFIIYNVICSERASVYSNQLNSKQRNLRAKSHLAGQGAAK